MKKYLLIIDYGEVNQLRYEVYEDFLEANDMFESFVVNADPDRISLYESVSLGLNNSLVLLKQYIDFME